jgi:hypothetical protein
VNRRPQEFCAGEIGLHFGLSGESLLRNKENFGKANVAVGGKLGEYAQLQPSQGGLAMIIEMRTYKLKPDKRDQFLQIFSLQVCFGSR